MKKEYKQPIVEILGSVEGIATLMSGSLGSNLKHPVEDSGVPGRDPIYSE